MISCFVISYVRLAVRVVVVGVDVTPVEVVVFIIVLYCVIGKMDQIY